MVAGWSTEVIEAVERWAATQPGSGRDPQGWRRVGAVSAGPDGWLVVDLRDDRTVADALSEPCLSGERGPDHEPAHPVEEIRNFDGVLLLREPAGVPVGCRELWARVLSPRFRTERLLDGLRAAEPAPLAEALAGKQLSGPPTSRAAAVGLLGAQVEAFRACLSPGVRLVWGPPGTGRTQVLARAVEELVRRGRRVLLVSPADVAVDAALLAALRRLPARPGAAVRVGPAHLAEIAGDPDVQLERRAATASAAVDEERGRVAAQLREFDALDAEIDALRTRLGDHDDDAYRAAAARLDAGRTLEELLPRVHAAGAALTAAESADRAAQAAVREAVRAQAALDPVRQALDRQRDTAAQLAQLDRRHRALQGSRDALAGLPPPSGWFARRARRRELQEAAAALESFVADAAGRRRALLTLQLEARAVAGPTDQPDFDEADRRVARARSAARATAEVHRGARRAHDHLRAAADAALAAGPATDVDRQLVARSRLDGLPARWERLRQLLGAQRTATGRRSALTARHRALLDRARTLRAAAEHRLIEEAAVVATTLARSRAHPAIAAGTFDVVLVDEAGAAPLAEVVLALCRARTTAVLLGDFLQLGPVLDRKVARDPDPGLAAWVRGTCFSHVGIRAPADAAAAPACTVLTDQSGVGAALRRLANDGGYEVLRGAPEVLGISAHPAADIVLVDVSTVPDLAVGWPGRAGGRWWAAGAVLSPALAELHLPEGPVGVLSPYRAQAGATLAALRDRGVVAGAAVGTVHALQHREYPTAVLDLVEDGRGQVVRGGRDQGEVEAAALRAFGVGSTRARHRLYLVVDGRAVGAARAGPLLALRRGEERGEIHRWSAAALLGLDDPPVRTGGSAFAGAAALLQRQVTVTDVQDAGVAGRELERHLMAARRRVWMWAPWIADRTEDVVPLVASAVRRGVEVRVFLAPDPTDPVASSAGHPGPQLSAAGATVIRADHEHRGILVVDEQTVVLGGRTLRWARPGAARAVMISISGRAFAERLLAELRVDELGTPRRCTACGEVMPVRRGGSGVPHWACRHCAIRVPLQRSSSANTCISGAQNRR